MKSSDVSWSKPSSWTRSSLPLKVTSLTLLALALLSAGCGTSSRQLVPGVEPAKIPPLSQSARQPKRSESFSASVSRDIESWEKKLTELEEPAKPAK